MNITHSYYGIEIPLEENYINTVCIEHPVVLSKLIQELWDQANGSAGGWLLSEKEKELSIPRTVECIYNPFSIDCNESRILTKIYNELKEDARTYLYEMTDSVNRQILLYLDNLIDQFPCALEYTLEPDVVSLLKSYKVRISWESISLEDKVVEYVRVIGRILKKTVIVMLNMKQYFSDDDLEVFLRTLLYEKVIIILIEGSDRPVLPIEKKYIIDSDWCTIKA